MVCACVAASRRSPPRFLHDLQDKPMDKPAYLTAGSANVARTVLPPGKPAPCFGAIYCEKYGSPRSHPPSWATFRSITLSAGPKSTDPCREENLMAYKSSLKKAWALTMMWTSGTTFLLAQSPAPAVSAERQILLRVKFAELDREKESQFGVNLLGGQAN